MKYEIGKLYILENPREEIHIRENVQPINRDAEEYLQSGTEEAESFLLSVKEKGVQEAVTGYVSEGKLYLNTGYHRYTATVINEISLPIRIVEEPSVSEQIATQIHSNKTRPVTVLQKGQAFAAYKAAIKAEGKKAPTQAQIAKEMGVTQAEVSTAITMAEAPTALVSSLEKGVISTKGAQAIIKEVKKASKSAEQEWKKENGAKVTSFEGNSDKLDKLEEQKHNFVNKEIDKVVKTGIKDFKESGKSTSRGRPKGSKKKTEQPVTTTTTTHTEREDEFTLIVSAEDSIADIFDNLLQGLKGTHGLEPKQFLAELEQSVKNAEEKVA